MTEDARPLIRRVTIALLLIGVGLRAWAYLGNPSLWLDEILLSRNILDLPLGDLLTQPLQLDQVAPRGFLLVEKAAVTLFGPSEFALRLFPFLCGIATLLVFARLAARALDGWAVPVAIALVAIGFPFIKFGAEVKQYGIDALASTILILVALDLRDHDASRRRLILTGLTGFIVIWFSQASVLVMASIGLATALEWLWTRDQRAWRALTVTVPMWAIACGVAVIAGLRSMTPSTREFMQVFWAEGFFPRPFDSVGDLRWFWERGISVFSDFTLLRYRWPVLLTFVAACGIVALWRRQRMLALMITIPILLVFAAAVAHQYPFRGRLLMFLIPGILLAVAAGTEWVRQRVSRLHPALGVATTLVILAAPVAAAIETPPPFDIEHHTTVLAHLQRNRQPGDIVYVLPLTRIGMQFYGPRFGLQPSEWMSANCFATNETREGVRDVDRFRGQKRVWFISAGPRPFLPVRAAVLAYLGTIGIKRDALSLPSATFTTAEIHLYDLSDPTRLASADAETFPLPLPPAPGRRSCRPWATVNSER